MNFKGLLLEWEEVGRKDGEEESSKCQGH